MRYDNGMLGMCISVLAIVGMILAGFALSVNQSERVVTGYEYVTDVSGLFDYSQDPQYVAYNPAANWTGFYTTDPDVTDGIDFDASGSANNFPIRQERTQTSSGTVDMDTLNLTQLSPPVVIEQPQLTRWGVVFDREAPTEGVPVFDVPNPDVATLEVLVEAMSLADGSNSVTITLGSSQDSPIVIPTDDWIYRLWAPPMSSKIDSYTATYYRDASAAVTVTIDLESGIAIGYTASGTVAWRGAASGMCIVYGGQAVEGSPTLWNLSTSVQYAAYESPTPIYMDTNQGISLSDASVSWSNGYPVGSMDILFRVPDTGTQYTNTISVPLTNGPDGQSVGSIEVYVAVASSGRVVVTISAGDDQQTVDIGQWRNFMLSLDFVNGSYSVTPVSAFATFNDYTLSGNTRMFDRITLAGTAGTVTWGYTGSSLLFGVVNTTVFMNTYGVVMTDPSLAITEYFPELADVRLNFYSFALYGSSITINGQTFAVDDSAMITIPGGGTHTLTNIYITLEDRTSLTFVNDGVTVDLGPTTTDMISFSGNWYFTTGLYEGYETTETYYDWTVDRFIFESDGAVIVFLGLLVLGTAIGAKVVGIRTLDIVVVACAGLFGYVMLGVF